MCRECHPSFFPIVAYSTKSASYRGQPKLSLSLLAEHDTPTFLLSCHSSPCSTLYSNKHNESGAQWQWLLHQRAQAPKSLIFLYMFPYSCSIFILLPPHLGQSLKPRRTCYIRTWEPATQWELTPTCM